MCVHVDFLFLITVSEAVPAPDTLEYSRSAAESDFFLGRLQLEFGSNFIQFLMF